jgi:hypothetical protein
MQPLGVMITNGGAHPPEDWAETTANKILDLIRVPSEAVSAELAEADRIAVEAGREAARQAKNLLKPQIVAALLSAHVDVHAGEAAALAADGAARAAAPADPGAHTEVDAVLAAVHALFEKTLFAAHFVKDEVKARVAQILHGDLAHSIELVRAYHTPSVN